MQKLTAANITDVALSRFGKPANERFREILTSALRHLHAFVREVRLTPEEWKAGIDFLVAAGHITDDKRNEFILLSDTLGVSALVDLLSHARQPAGATDSSLLGPFYREGVPEMPSGASIANGTPGETVVVRGLVTGAGGRPVANASLDVWQAAPNGLYDLQDESQPDLNMRGKFRTDPSGRFEFRSLKPLSYPVPHDGPAGELLLAQGRHPYRPAHIHFIVTAPGYEPLTTALYIAGDPYIDSDAVFGAKDSLTVQYKKGQAGQGDSSRATGEPDSIEFNFNLVPAERP
ncbi:MAG TPA: intradiol ring-cleavage dioxygenase [Candidatus Binataceae bacterium]|nr:intradiol ring-cleavage dioxygenase [Candidatus Binataceae bacterium]